MIMNDAERDREMNLRYFGSAPAVNYGDVGTGSGARDYPPDDAPEDDRYGIRIVYPDGLENDIEFGTSLRVARMTAGAARELLAGSVFEPRVVIIDLSTGRIIDEETT